MRAAALVAVCAAAFLITWPLQKRQTRNVDSNHLRGAASALAAAALDPGSGLPESMRETLREEAAAPDFPSDRAVALFVQIEADTAMLLPEARYRWELSYPVFESYRQAVLNRHATASLFTRFGFNPDGRWWPNLLTHQILHAGWAHFLFNMVFLWMAAAIAEASLGWHLFWLAPAGGVAAAFAQTLAGIPSGDSLVGASGAIAALMGYLLVSNPSARVTLFYFVLLIVIPRYGVFGCPLWFFLPVWLLLQAFMASVGHHLGTVDVAYGAHVGGFAFGCLAGVAWKTLAAGSLPAR